MTRFGSPLGSVGNVTSSTFTDTFPAITWFSVAALLALVTAGPVADRSS
jgi:hypothetical protein